MDSMDRSLLDCDLSGDQLATHSKPFLSLDPGKLVGLGGGSEAASSIRTSSRNLPDGGSCVPGKAEEAVAEICSESGDSPGRGGGERSESQQARRRETVVRFEAAVPISTLLVEASHKMEANMGGASSKGDMCNKYHFHTGHIRNTGNIGDQRYVQLISLSHQIKCQNESEGVTFGFVC